MVGCAVMRGKVIRFEGGAAILQIDGGREGFLHVGELSWTRRFSSCSDVLQVGRELDVVEGGRCPEGSAYVAVSHRRVAGEPWTAGWMQAHLNIGSQHEVIVMDIPSSGKPRAIVAFTAISLKEDQIIYATLPLETRLRVAKQERLEVRISSLNAEQGVVYVDFLPGATSRPPGGQPPAATPAERRQPAPADSPPGPSRKPESREPSEAEAAVPEQPVLPRFPAADWLLLVGRAESDEILVCLRYLAPSTLVLDPTKVAVPTEHFPSTLRVDYISQHASKTMQDAKNCYSEALKRAPEGASRVVVVGASVERAHLLGAISCAVERSLPVLFFEAPSLLCSLDGALREKVPLRFSMEESLRRKNAIVRKQSPVPGVGPFSAIFRLLAEHAVCCSALTTFAHAWYSNGYKNKRFYYKPGSNGHKHTEQIIGFLKKTDRKLVRAHTPQENGNYFLLLAEDDRLAEPLKNGHWLEDCLAQAMRKELDNTYEIAVRVELSIGSLLREADILISNDQGNLWLVECKGGQYSLEELQKLRDFANRLGATPVLVSAQAGQFERLQKTASNLGINSILASDAFSNPAALVSNRG